jgi:hypothetical protein
LLVSDAKLPDVVDLSPYFLRTGNQGPRPDCTINAIVDLVEAYWVKRFAKAKKLSPLKVKEQGIVPQLSRNFVGYNARLSMDPPQHKGPWSCWMRLALDATKRLGACPERDWPYKMELMPIQPPISRYHSAVKWRIDGFHRVSQDNMKRETMRLLAAGHPVACRTETNDDWKLGYNGTVLTNPRRGNGHAIVLVGYSHFGGSLAFKFKNSWGISWGNQGYGWLHEEYLDWNRTGRGWVVS